MIASLSGILLVKQPDHTIVDVGGVGYEVLVSGRTYDKLPSTGDEVFLYIYTSVREDAITLYGFSKLSDRSLFRTLIKVNGVGAKLALTILSGMDAGNFAACVQAGDTAALVKLPGVGKKTAERLVVEMRDRLADWDVPQGVPSGSAPASKPDVANPVEEAVSALIALGYKPQEASRMVRVVDSRDLSTEDIIRTALQATVQS